MSRGPLFYSSTAAIGQNHGVFGVSQPPPQSIVATGTGRAAMVSQMAWGPSSGDASALYLTSGQQDFLNTFFPLGMSRNFSGYLMEITGAWPELVAVRVSGVGASRASSTLGGSVTATAKWPGTQGNSITVTVGPSSDGSANHWKLTASVSNSAGTTSEVFDNINTSNSGAIALPNFANSILLGALTVNTNVRPTNGTYTLSGASDGTAIAASDYIGSQGGGEPNKGFALLEGDDLIRHVWADDPGAALRAAVNAGEMNHVNFLLDRTGYIAGPSGQTPAAVQADVLNYVSTNIVYVDPWIYVNDDAGNKQLVPGNAIGASLGANASPSTSFAWRDLTLRRFLGTVVGLESKRGATKASNTALGISTIIPYKGGGFCFEAAKVTAMASSQAQGNWTRTQMGIYIATAVEDNLNNDVDQPNVALNQREIMGAIDTFLADLEKNQDVNPNTAPYIKGYVLQKIGAANTDASLTQGNFIIAASVKIGLSMERIIFSVTYGESVVITPVAA